MTKIGFDPKQEYDRVNLVRRVEGDWQISVHPKGEDGWYVYRGTNESVTWFLAELAHVESPAPASPRRERVRLRERAPSRAPVQNNKPKHRTLLGR